MIELSSITIKNLKNNKLKKHLPEFYELKKIVENNDWHNKDNVFNHTLSVLKKLAQLFKQYRSELSKSLSKKINKYSRKQLLFLSALLHDIAKKETIVKMNGTTQCPLHEIKSALKTRRMLNRFDLTPQEEKFVVQLVKNHGLAHKMPEMGSKFYKKFKITHRDIFPEIILLVMADTLGSSLNHNNPKDFKMRLNFYKSILKNY